MSEGSEAVLCPYADQSCTRESGECPVARLKVGDDPGVARVCALACQYGKAKLPAFFYRTLRAREGSVQVGLPGVPGRRGGS